MNHMPMINHARRLLALREETGAVHDAVLQHHLDAMTRAYLNPRTPDRASMLLKVEIDRFEFII